MLRLESLESRRVFATASLTSGVLSIDLDQTDEVAYLTNEGTSLRLASSHLSSELSFSTAAVSSIQVTDTTLRTGQSFSFSYGLPLSLSGSLSVSQIETVVFGNGITALSNGNYFLVSANWDSGATVDVGAVTWGNGTSGISGVVSSSNSIVGQTAGVGSSWAITTASNLDAFLASNPSDGSGRVVLGSSDRGFSLPSTPAGSLQAANGSVSLRVAETNLYGTISSNANVTIAPSQTARQIDLGSKPSGILGLTDTELDWIAAANLRIGNSTSGDLTISSPISDRPPPRCS